MIPVTADNYRNVGQALKIAFIDGDSDKAFDLLGELNWLAQGSRTLDDFVARRYVWGCLLIGGCIAFDAQFLESG